MKRLTSLLAAGAFTLSLAACHNADADKNAAITAQQATIDSMKMEIAKQRVVDSMQGVTQFVADSLQEVAQVEKEKAVANTAATKTRRSKTRSSGSSNGYNSGASYSNAAYEPAPVYEAPPAKRGWSAKAKGAVIGAGAGAVGGAIINKRNRGAGAVIGGLGGAAIGTGVGAILDRKNGR